MDRCPQISTGLCPTCAHPFGGVSHSSSTPPVDDRLPGDQTGVRSRDRRRPPAVSGASPPADGAGDPVPAGGKLSASRAKVRSGVRARHSVSGAGTRRSGEVSVAEFRGGQGGGQEERNPEMGFDRTPPQDLAAEQCVLGAMMLSKDAIADVIETLRGTDFYRPAHEIVFDAVTDLYAPGRAGRRDHRRRRADQARRDGPDRRRAVRAHPGRRRCRSRPTPATTRTSSGRRRSCAAWSRPAPRSSRSGTPVRARSTTSSTRPRRRSTRSPRSAPPRTTRR